MGRVNRARGLRGAFGPGPARPDRRIRATRKARRIRASRYNRSAPVGCRRR